MTAQSQSLITVVVANKSLGVFQARTGGETESETSKYRPGGGAKQKARRGQPDIQDVTVTREWERERDLTIEADLRKVAGRAAITITDQALDEDDIAYGKPTIYTGVLMNVSGGDSDANSDDGRELELTAMILEIS